MCILYPGLKCSARADKSSHHIVGASARSIDPRAPAIDVKIVQLIANARAFNGFKSRWVSASESISNIICGGRDGTIRDSKSVASSSPANNRACIYVREAAPLCTLSILSHIYFGLRSPKTEDRRP